MYLVWTAFPVSENMLSLLDVLLLTWGANKCLHSDGSFLEALSLMTYWWLIAESHWTGHWRLSSWLPTWTLSPVSVAQWSIGFLNHPSESLSDFAPSHSSDMCWSLLLFLPGVLKKIDGMVSDCAFLFEVSPRSESVHSVWCFVCLFVCSSSCWHTCLRFPCAWFPVSSSRMISVGRWICGERKKLRNRSW